MLRDFPAVKSLEQTDDVLNEATLRLLRALKVVQPGSAREFFALASTQIRRELLDLIDKIAGPNGPAVPQPIPEDMVPDGGPSPQELEEWTEFHRQIEELPPEEREVIDLHFYQAFSKAKVAEILGVDVRTVQRRWNAGLGRLRSRRQGDWPPL